MEVLLKKAMSRLQPWRPNPQSLEMMSCSGAMCSSACRMVVATCRPGDAFVAISSTGRTREVIEAVEMARHHRAATIAITTPGSDLARAADMALTVAVPEYPDTLKPSASRFAFLAVIDLLAAATGYTIGPPARETLRRIKYAIQTHRRGAALEPLGD
jgi:DNA-binding MurR/RpiR family transcriptional regulator